MLLFLNFPEETRKLLGPGTLAEGALTGTYSTRPSSTTLEILTPDRDVEYSDDGLIPPTAYHCSCESFNILRRSRASLTHPQTSATTWEPRRICSRRRSRSLSLRGFPSKSSTRHPGVSSLNRWSRAKCLTP